MSYKIVSHRDLCKYATASRTLVALSCCDEPKLENEKVTVKGKHGSLERSVLLYIFQNHDVRLFYSSYDDAIKAHIFRYY